MTYFTINDREEHVQIRDAKGDCLHFCVGADLSEPDEDKPVEDENKQEKNSVKTKKATFDLEFDDEQVKDKNQKVVSPLKKALFWICGIESSLNRDDLKDAAISHHVDTSIDQNPFWSAVLDINAVIAMSIGGFCLAFLNKYN